MFRRPPSDAIYPSQMDPPWYHDYATEKATQHIIDWHRDQGNLYAADVGVRNVRSTMLLKLKVALSSFLSLVLMTFAGMQSYKQFLITGWATFQTDNNKIAIINAVIAVYGAITGMMTRVSVTKCLNLIAIKALSTNGRFVWSAKTWAYLSHANGPWYTMTPLFIAGLTATAVISILPVAVTDPKHYVYMNVSVSQDNLISCMDGNYISPSIWCTGASLASNLLHSYATYSGSNPARSQQIGLNDQISSRRSLGYPWQLVNYRIEELGKYNVTSNEAVRESNKTSCAWVLDKVPLKCAFTNYSSTESELQLQVKSPYSSESFIINNSSNPPQGISVNTVDDHIELAGVGVFTSVATGNSGVSTAYVCSSRALTETHIGRFITTQWNGFSIGTQIDLANDTSCKPAYDLPSMEDVKEIFTHMAGGLYQFASVDGTNTLILSFGNGYFDIGLPIFDDANSQFEDGMGSYMATMLSIMYTAKPGRTPPLDRFTRVEGGALVTTVGLGRASKFYIWLALAIVPLTTLTIAVLIPSDYIPSWDIMNPLEALATNTVIDERKVRHDSRSSDIRLGVVDGKIVASNTNLPVRITKGHRW